MKTVPFFFSHSCHLGTLEGQDHPSDYLIRLEPHWHLQAAGGTAAWDMDTDADAASCASPQGLGGVPGSQPMLPSGMDPTRQQGLHERLTQTDTAAHILLPGPCCGTSKVLPHVFQSWLHVKIWIRDAFCVDQKALHCDHMVDKIYLQLSLWPPPNKYSVISFYSWG